MKTIAIHQPNFCAWLPYYLKMKQVDEFVYLDDVQFTKGSYINRCKISENKYITVPVNYKYGENINQVKISNSEQTLNNLHNKISLNYPKIVTSFNWLLNNDKINNLSLLNIQMSDVIRRLLNINTPTIKSSSLNITSTSSNRILEICKVLNADVYITGKGGLNYLDIDSFNKANIDVQIIDNSITYPNVSVLKNLNDARH